MARLPRDINGVELSKKLSKLGYTVTRQSGSHIRLCCIKGEKEHCLTIPAHKVLKIGTLHSIISDIADFLGIDRATLIEKI